MTEPLAPTDAENGPRILGGTGFRIQVRDDDRQRDESQVVVLEPEGDGHQGSGSREIRLLTSLFTHRQEESPKNEDHQEALRLRRVPVAEVDVPEGVDHRAHGGGGRSQVPFCEPEDEIGGKQQPEDVDGAHPPHGDAENFRDQGKEEEDARRLRIPTIAVEYAAVQDAFTQRKEDGLVAADGKPQHGKSLDGDQQEGTPKPEAAELLAGQKTSGDVCGFRFANGVRIHSEVKRGVSSD